MGPLIGDSHSTGSGMERENKDDSGNSLQEHLLWQMRLTPFSEIERTIAIIIIDSIADNGYLIGTIKNVQQSLGNGSQNIEDNEIEAVVHSIQRFDPVGVAVRDLRECLLMQLNLYESRIDHVDLLTELIDKHLDTLAERDYVKIKRTLKVTEEQLTELVQAIQLLNPRPGGKMEIEKTEFIVPDVYIQKINSKWFVNHDNTLRLQIAERNAQLSNRNDSSSENIYLKDNLQEARWFLKSLQNSNETLLKVSEAITDKQRGFLNYWEEAMKPLMLADIASKVNMHESIVSRVTAMKYIHTPSEIFESKHFFSSHVGTDAGGTCSAIAVRAIIKDLIASEMPTKSLCDSGVPDILGKQGINVARRTIVKYRKYSAIAPSNERKRLISIYQFSFINRS